MRPIKYAVYKGIKGSYGAVQFSLSPPVYVCNQCNHRNYQFPDGPQHNSNPATCNGQFELREGAVFVDIANATGPNLYDWEHKTIFALSVNDLGKVLAALKAGIECKLLHDPGAQTEKAGLVTKTMSFTALTEKGFMFYMYEKNKSGEEKKFMIPFTVDEVAILGTLITSAIPSVLGW